jgi:hypothetical protein
MPAQHRALRAAVAGLQRYRAVQAAADKYRAEYRELKRLHKKTARAFEQELRIAAAGRDAALAARDVALDELARAQKHGRPKGADALPEKTPRAPTRPYALSDSDSSDSSSDDGAPRKPLLMTSISAPPMLGVVPDLDASFEADAGNASFTSTASAMSSASSRRRPAPDRSREPSRSRESSTSRSREPSTSSEFSTAPSSLSSSSSAPVLAPPEDTSRTRIDQWRQHGLQGELLGKLGPLAQPPGLRRHATTSAAARGADVRREDSRGSSRSARSQPPAPVHRHTPPVAGQRHTPPVSGQRHTPPGAPPASGLGLFMEHAPAPAPEPRRRAHRARPRTGSVTDTEGAAVVHHRAHARVQALGMTRESSAPGPARGLARVAEVATPLVDALSLDALPPARERPGAAALARPDSVASWGTMATPSPRPHLSDLGLEELVRMRTPPARAARFEDDGARTPRTRRRSEPDLLEVWDGRLLGTAPLGDAGGGLGLSLAPAPTPAAVVPPPAQAPTPAPVQMRGPSPPKPTRPERSERPKAHPVRPTASAPAPVRPTVSAPAPGPARAPLGRPQASRANTQTVAPAVLMPTHATQQYAAAYYAQYQQAAQAQAQAQAHAQAQGYMVQAPRQQRRHTMNMPGMPRYPPGYAPGAMGPSPMTTPWPHAAPIAAHTPSAPPPPLNPRP